MSIKFNFLSLVLGAFRKPLQNYKKIPIPAIACIFFAKIQANKYKLYLLNMVKKKVDSPTAIACIFFLQKFNQINTSYTC